MKNLFLLAALLVLLFGCTKEQKVKEYEYVVTCTSDTCQIIYANEYGNIEDNWCMTEGEWHYKFVTQNDDAIIYLYAQNACNYGYVTAAIICDGVVIKQKTDENFVELN